MIRRRHCVTGLLVVILTGCGPTNRVASLPIADAGFDAVVDVGAQALLDGAASLDPGGAALIYQWSLVASPAGSTSVIISADAVQARLTPDVAGLYLTALAVSNGKRESEPDFVSIQARGNTNQVPEAEIRCARNQCNLAHGDGSLQLLGNESWDPDGDAISYAWSQVLSAADCDQCPDIVPCNPVSAPVTWTTSLTGENVSFTAPFAVGDLIFRLVVTDEHSASGATCVAVRSTNNPPLAVVRDTVASAEEGAWITLDGSVSDDSDLVDRTALTFAWSPPPSAEVIYDPAAANTKNVRVKVGGSLTGTSVTFGLTVSDPYSSSTACAAPVVACNNRPSGCCGEVVVAITDVSRATGAGCSFDSECASADCGAGNTCN